MAKRTARTPRAKVRRVRHEATSGDIMASPPATREALRVFLQQHLGVRVAESAILEGSHAPLDYLCHSFFEGHDRWPALPGAVRVGAVDCVVWANRGGGKTFLGAVATALDLLFKPGIEVRVLGGSFEQSKRMYAHLKRLFDPRARPALAAMVDGKIGERRLRLTNGSEVELLSQSQASIRGTRVHKLRCDEVELFDRDVWEAAQLVTKSARLGGIEVVGSIECLSTMHLAHGVMHDLVCEAREGSRRLFRWGVVDALERCGDEHACHAQAAQAARAIALPQLHASPAPDGQCALWGECQGRAKLRPASEAGHMLVRDALAMKRRVAVATWESEMLCLRPRRSDVVLPEFDVRRHVVAQSVCEARGPGLTWVGGMDFGYRAPTVVLIGAVDAGGTLTIVDERVASGCVLDEHIAAIRAGLARPGVAAWPSLAWIGVDPAGAITSDQTGMSSVSVMRESGFVVKTRRMGVAAGLALVRARLAPADGRAPTLLIHERCETLIESLEKYHYPTDDPESDTPVKGEGHDHAVDALRYLIQNLDQPYKTASGRYV